MTKHRINRRMQDFDDLAASIREEIKVVQYFAQVTALTCFAIAGMLVGIMAWIAMR